MTRLFVDGVQIGEGEGPEVSPEDGAMTFNRVRIQDDAVQWRPLLPSVMPLSPSWYPHIPALTVEGQDGTWITTSWSQMARAGATTDLVFKDLHLVSDRPRIRGLNETMIMFDDPAKFDKGTP